MEYRTLGVHCAEIVVAWADGCLEEREAWELIDGLRAAWESHTAFLVVRNAGQYREVPAEHEAAFFVGHSSDLLAPRDSKITRAIGEILLAHRVDAIDVCEAADLLKELIACEAESRKAERLLAERKTESRPANRISQYEGVLDGRD